MKKALLFLGLLLSAQFIQSQIVNIPDSAFKAALLTVTPSIDTNNDGEIQVSEATAITQLSIPSGSYTNATGINAFTNLQSLSFYSCYQLAALDATGLTQLTTLSIMYSGLSSLNITGLTSLQTLRCEACYGLAALNTTTNTGLVTFSLSDSELTAIDLSPNTNLQNVTINSCYELTNINLNGLANLVNLTCIDNWVLASINLSGANNLQSINCRSSALTSLNVANFTHLETLDCSENHISTLNFTGANNLRELMCAGNALGTLTVANLANLEVLDCSNNGLASLTLTGLSSLTGLNCSENSLTTLNVNQLTSLTGLGCSYNQLTSLDVSNLVNLTSLGCNDNQMTAINVVPLVNLTSFNCWNNQITSLNLSAQTQMENLYCGDNPIGSLDVTTMPLLRYLFCYNNGLTSLDVSHCPELIRLECSNNALTSIDLHNLHDLTEFYGDVNLFTELDFSGCQGNYMSMSLTQCPNLEYINLKNGIEPFGINIDGLSWTPMRYICVNEHNALPLLGHLEYLNSNHHIQVNSYCSFTPGGDYNTITGNATFDLAGNGCGAGDLPMEYIKMNINDGTDSGSTFSNSEGEYNFYTQSGSFVLTPSIENPYFQISPANVTVNFADNDNHTETQNFCISPLGIHNDLDITIIPTAQPRPGFDASYQLIYKNKGNQTLSGNINLQFNDAVLDFVSATPMTTSQGSGVLNWAYTNLAPFETRSIDFTMNVNSPMETPPVNIDDILNFTATISPLGEDETPNDNIYQLTQVVVGSFDPNDKTCLEGNAITPDMVGDYLNYVIRFQNSGTFAAENVVVKDVLDATKFDISTFQLTGSSHPHVTRIDGNRAEFIFEHINLPAEIDDEPGSHGFVAFKIKTKNNLVLGNNVQNTADIYFDFNFPIVTNTTSTTVSVLGVSDLERASVSVSPIPVIDILQIKAEENITSIQLFDIQGRLLQVKQLDSTNTTLDFSGQPRGVYLVKIHTEKGMKVQKVIKE